MKERERKNETQFSAKFIQINNFVTTNAKLSTLWLPQMI